MLHTKKRILLLCMMTWVCLVHISAQPRMDISELVADTKTFAFNDSKSTVKGYIYEELDANTNCCGADRIYLEVRIHPSGYVVEAKTLTGKNECFKRSAIDIVKNIKWEAKDFKGTKPVYFEIRPDINCDGGRDNSYEQLAISNNELLDASGNPKNPEDGSLIYLGDPDTDESTSTSAANEPKEEVKGEEEKPAEDTPSEEDVAANQEEAVPSEPVAEPTSIKKEVVEKPTEELEEPGKEVVADNTSTLVQSETQPKETAPSAEPQASSLLVSADTPGRRASQQAVEANAAAVDTPQTPIEEATPLNPEEQAEKEAEIMVLREQLNELRAQEEAVKQQQLRRQEIRERRRQAQMERQAELQARRDAEAQGNDPFAGEASDDPFGGEGDPSPDQDPDQEDLDRLSQELSEIQNRKRELEDSRKRDAEELEQFIRDRVRLEEEMRRKEEEIARKREQQELDRMVEDRNRIEDEKRVLEGEMQRLMDEIQRLQDEMGRKVAELERQQQDIQRINTTIAQREQEINQQRMMREQQLEQELAMMRQQADIESASLYRDVPATAGGTVPSIGIDPNLLRAADTSAAAAQLVNQIRQLQQQVQVLQNQYVQGSGNTTTGGASGVVAPSISGGISGGANLPEGSSRADQDRSWETIDYNAPEGTQPTNTGTIGTRSQVTNPTGYDPVLGYSPDSSHAGTYENTSGPRFRNVQYGTGTNAMNRFLADQLKTRGVCGTVAAFAELTVNGNGQVVSTRIIKANSTQAMINLPGIFSGLTFLPTYSNIPQRTNLSFEMNIPCAPGQMPAAGGFTPTSTN